MFKWIARVILRNEIEQLSQEAEYYRRSAQSWRNSAIAQRDLKHSYAKVVRDFNLQKAVVLKGIDHDFITTDEISCNTITADKIGQ